MLIRRQLVPRSSAHCSFFCFCCALRRDLWLKESSLPPLPTSDSDLVSLLPASCVMRGLLAAQGHVVKEGNFKLFLLLLFIGFFLSCGLMVELWECQRPFFIMKSKFIPTRFNLAHIYISASPLSIAHLCVLQNKYPINKYISLKIPSNCPQSGDPPVGKYRY